MDKRRVKKEKNISKCSQSSDAQLSVRYAAIIIINETFSFGAETIDFVKPAILVFKYFG